jgi:hypothetical protein
MFAPPIAKAQTKTTASSTAQLALQRSRFVARPTDRGAVEHVQIPTSSVGESRTSWDFSAIPVFSPDRPNRVRPVDTALPPAGAKQAKLVIGRISDPLEHEADRVADQVMRTAGPAFVAISGGSTQISRKCAVCEAKEKEEEEKVQRKPAAPEDAVGEAPAIVHEVLRSPGQPLDSVTRSFFEPRFGRTLSHIRVHTDAAAAASARAISARAYTRGAHIVFAGGSYQTATATGRHLLAHELAHTAQQEHGASSVVQRANCRDYDESTAAECAEHTCITADRAKGKCKKTGLHICMCGPARMWRMMPDWLLALLSAAALVAIVACFATGVCEFAAAVAGLGALAAAAVIAILKAAGIKDSGA